MKRIFQFTLVALAAAAITVACQKPTQETPDKPDTETPDDQTPDDQTPDDQTPEDLEGAWSVIGKFNEWGGDVEMTKGSDGWYVAENVELVGVTSTSDGFKFRRDKGWDVNLGLDGDAAVVDLDTEIALEKNGGNICLAKDGVYTLYLKPTEKLAKIHFVKDIEGPGPEPEGLVMDGDAADWAVLNPDYVVSLELPAEAEKTGIKSAKLYYDDKLYVLVELSDETLADAKARLHVYFDVDGSGLLNQNGWVNSAIDYVTEGKIHEGGAFVSYGSPLYATLEEVWACTDTGFTPAYESGGAGNLYELSMDFANAPSELPVAFNVGVDVVYSDWSCNGFLPVAEKLARIVKVGETDPGEPQSAVEMDWDFTPSEAYLADTNLWKAADADNTITFLYHPNWADPTVEPTAEFKESTYVLTLMDADGGNAYSGQMIITPTNDVIVDPAKTYNFSVTIGSSTGTSVWIKMHQPGVNWPEVFETNGAEAVANRIAIAAGETKEIKIEGIKSLYSEALPQELLFDFAPHSALNTIYIKDIVLEEVKAPAKTPTDFAAIDDGAEMEFEGIVASVAKNGFIVTDGTTNIYVFKPATTPALGDKVSVKATKTTYYNLIEAKQDAEVTVLASGNEIPYTTPVDITANFDAYPDAEHTSDLLSVTGELVVDGNYVNLNVEGATARQGSLQGVDITAYNGKKIKLLGYYIGTSGTGGKFLTISVVSAEEVGAAGPVSITIDGDMSDWAGIAGVETPDAVCKIAKVWNDADNYYFYLASEPGPRGSQLWGSAYYYIDFDLDNDSTTGEEEKNGVGGLWDAYTYFNFFVGTAEAPEIAENPGGTGSHGITHDGVVAKGIITDTLIEIELSIPRANIKDNGGNAGDVITIGTSRSKDGTKIIIENYVVK